MDRAPIPLPGKDRPQRLIAYGRSPVIFASLVNGCWRVFRAVIALAFIAAMAVGGYLFFRLDDETRRLSESVLARLCEPMVARVGSARYVAGRGVTMFEVQVLDPHGGGAPRPVLEIDELRVEGRFDVATLLSGAPEVRRVVAKSPRVYAERSPGGEWNLSRFRAPQESGGPPPVVELQNATLHVRDGAPGAGRQLKIEHFDASLAPSEDRTGLVLRASARESLARSLRVEGLLGRDGAVRSLRVNVQGLPVTPELTTTLAALGGVALPLPAMRGVADLDGAFDQGGDAPGWRVGFALNEAEARLPFGGRPLGSVRASGEASDSGLRVDRFTADWGDAKLRLAGRRTGWGWNAPMALRVRLDGFDVAQAPVALAPASLRGVWARFQPAGRADVALDAQYDGRAWSPRATVRLRDASFEDTEKFAYRLTGAAGSVLLNGGADQPEGAPPAGPGTNVSVDLTAMVEGAPVRIAAALDGLESMRPVSRPLWGAAPPGPQRPGMPPGWIEVSGTGVPITPRIVAALPNESVRRFVESLHPSGRIDLRWRADRRDPASPSHDTSLDLRLVDCRINYDRFPYPLSGVTGWVRQRGDDWEFRELRSADVQGKTLVSGSGELRPQAGGHALVLRFDGEDAPLDQTLYAALPPGAQEAWAFLRPRGQLGFTAHVSRPPGVIEPVVRLTMRPQAKVTIEPVFSENGQRYRLEELDGQFDWQDNHLTMRGARASHGRTAYTADGEWAPAEGGGWRLGLQSLHADRLAFDRDFMAAAPAGLRGVIQSLEPAGYFDLFNSRLEVTQRGAPAADYRVEWDLSVNCHQASVQAGVPLEGISGVVRLNGESDGASAQTACDLRLDSLFWNDLQLTEVRGPLWADGTDCFLGEGVGPKVRGEPRPVVASAYGGKVEINSWVRHGVRPRYGLSADLRGVDVARLSSEWLARPEALRGSLDGRMEFEGTGAWVTGLTGKGQLAVSEADLYELPLLLSMLKYFRNRTPDNTAFNRLEANYTLQGDVIQFANLDLLGDAVSLYGRGSATLDRELDLTFHSIVGRNELVVPMLRSLVGQASEQLLRLRVLGTTDAPEIRREALPMVGNMFEQLQADLTAPAASTGSRAPEQTTR